MAKIQVLDQITIDKIAAGEVIERPASVVKELVENAIDANATAITVEIQDGGIALIRISDNGCGMAAEEVPRAFLRHSTSKIQTIDDLTHITSLGFRGEALSSIAAVSQVELYTGQKNALCGTHYVIAGGAEQKIEETGTPNGTTFLIRQLFYNIPARRKFLKTPMTETGHIYDLMMRLALSHPNISFRFLNNGQEKLRTSGNGKIKDVIYQLYGRDTASNLIPIHFQNHEMEIEGYLGKPILSRGNRNFENYFVNGRYIRSSTIAKAIESAYKDFMMQHRFPFVVLYFTMPSEELDINVHPTKMEVRFQKQQIIYNTIFDGIYQSLTEPELISNIEIPSPAYSTETTENQQKTTVFPKKNVDKSVETVDNLPKNEGIHDEEYFIQKMKERVHSYHQQNVIAKVEEKQPDHIREATEYQRKAECTPQNRFDSLEKVERAPNKKECTLQKSGNLSERALQSSAKSVQQLDLFEEKFLNREKVSEYHIIGQIFGTYWLVQFHENLYIIDQHAAHERVLYERTLREMQTREYTSQILSPPLILTLSLQEAETLTRYLERFQRLGFEIEPFGGKEFAVRAVPDNLFGIARKDLLLEMLDDLADDITTSMTPEMIDEKVASMSCKAAVKGHQRISTPEIQVLLEELLKLENPYHCPHGRPTIISISKKELEKKFKRIV
ncbi:MAG: DNA mismatch repair endonuclease MutL [Hespellia sp.]|nr:DNA mismatch repair endonuclease MutL [Hespellia sp.]